MEKPTKVTRRILLIDDDEDLREIFYITLSAIVGVEILLAESGKVGLALALEERVDAILLDVMMPEMDGEAVLQQLQSNPLTAVVPVIFMTARSYGEDRQHLLAIGGRAVISKACKPSQIAAQVLNILNKIYLN